MTLSRQIGRLAADFTSDLRYALRVWTARPALAGIAVLSLAAGIGLNTSVFSIINAVFLQSIRGVPEPGRIVSIGARSPFSAYREVREGATSLAGVAAWQPIGVEIRVRGIALRRAVPVVSDTYFETLRVRPWRGRFFEPSRSAQPTARAEVVLDQEFWSSALGGDEHILGETISLNGQPATVIGVAPASFHGSGPVRPPLWASMDMKPALTSAAADWEAAGENGWRIVARLSPGVSIQQANAELAVLAGRVPHRFPSGPLQASQGPEQLTGPLSGEKRIEFLLVVVLPLVVVGLILWIGCSNVANLLLARASARRREIAIRFATGATRIRIVRLLLTESLVLAAAGAAAGVLVAAWTTELVWLAVPEAPRVEVELDGNVLFYTAFVAVIATLLFGLAPALHGTRVDVAPLLKGEAGADGDRGRGAMLRRFFLVTQFACSMALLVVAATFVRTLISTHAGERAQVIDHVTTAYVETGAASDAAREQYWDDMREQLRRLSYVTAVSMLEPRQPARMQLTPEGAGRIPGGPTVAVQRVDGEYLQATGTQLLAGHDLAGPDGAVERVLVNERAARQFWTTTEVVGKRLALDDLRQFEITGVVRDDGSDARVFRRLAAGRLAAANVYVRTSEPAGSVVDRLRSTFLDMSGDRTFTRVSTLRQAITGPLQRLTALAVTIGAMVLALATIGLYGSVSFVTVQRTREIAIRVAIGAPRMAVLRLLARDGVLVVAAGAALGLLLAGVGFRFMSGMVFARWTLEPITVIGVLTAFSAATLAACYLPGRRALRIAPIDVLRAD